MPPPGLSFMTCCCSELSGGVWSHWRKRRKYRGKHAWVCASYVYESTINVSKLMTSKW